MSEARNGALGGSGPVTWVPGGSQQQVGAAGAHVLEALAEAGEDLADGCDERLAALVAVLDDPRIGAADMELVAQCDDVLGGHRRAGALADDR